MPNRGYCCHCPGGCHRRKPSNLHAPDEPLDTVPEDIIGHVPAYRGALYGRVVQAVEKLDVDARIV